MRLAYEAHVQGGGANVLLLLIISLRLFSCTAAGTGIWKWELWLWVWYATRTPTDWLALAITWCFWSCNWSWLNLRIIIDDCHFPFSWLPCTTLASSFHNFTSPSSTQLCCWSYQAAVLVHGSSWLHILLSTICACSWFTGCPRPVLRLSCCGGWRWWHLWRLRLVNQIGIIRFRNHLHLHIRLRRHLIQRMERCVADLFLDLHLLLVVRLLLLLHLLRWCMPLGHRHRLLLLLLKALHYFEIFQKYFYINSNSS